MPDMSLRPPVRYRIVPKDPAAHLYEVTLTLAEPSPAGQRFSLPAWIPGSYLVRDFARHVVSLEADTGRMRVGVEKRDKHTWQVAPCAGELTLRYEVYAWDLSVRGAHLDTTHAFFNGSSVFLTAHGREDDRCEVEIAPPDGDSYQDWRVATAMARAPDTQPWAFGTYTAANYEELIDHPVEIGRFTLAEFAAEGVPHAIAITGRHDADMPRLMRDLAQVCAQQIRFFATPAPMTAYLFLVTAVGDGYGGLEHRASTSLICRRSDLPRAGEDSVSDSYRTFLGLASHEYFHSWNVKRIRPAAFAPPDLGRENYTRDLWVYEGITSYYDDLMLRRAGLITQTEYLRLLAETVTRVLRTPGRHRQSIADSSFDAWIKFYRPDENTPNAVVSYYAKGALVALALDLTLRLRTDGRCSLDDVMRALWTRHGQSGAGVPEGGLERVAAELSGHDLRAFFDAAVRGTDDPPFEALLAPFGIALQLRAAELDDDKGGTPVKPPSRARAVLGARVSNGAETRLAHVQPGGGAHAAGLSAGDLLVALNGLRVSGNLDKLLARHAPGERVQIHAFRRDELMTFTVVLDTAPADTCVLTMVENADDSTRARRDAWLDGPR